MNILVVDSDPQSAEFTQTLILDDSHQLMSAFDVEDAREMVVNNSISLVLLDWYLLDNMAAELCKWLRSKHVDQYTYIICITEFNDDTSIIEALSSGADNVISHPISPTELQERITSAQRILEYQALLVKKNQRLVASFDHLMKDFMEITSDLVDAGRVQKCLLPPTQTFRKIDVHGILRPATQLSGDTFNYFTLGENYLAFFIADAVGHGSASAMVSYAVHHQVKPQLHGICYTHLRESKSVAEAVVNTVADLNKQFAAGDREVNRWFTMIYGLIDLSTGKVTLCQAGQPPALHCSTSGNLVTEIGSGGFPVGLFEEATYTTEECLLEPGDKLLLCSDGAVECQSASDEEFGIENLKLALQEFSELGLQETATALTAKLVDWRGCENFTDDLSVLLFQHAA